MLSCFSKRGRRTLAGCLCAIFGFLSTENSHAMESITKYAIAENAIEFRDLSAVPGTVTPGETVSVLVALNNNTTELAGYQFNARLLLSNLISGSIEFDFGASNFYSAENLIAQGGGVLNPYKKKILSANTELYFLAFEASGQSVNLAETGHDVLAELVFTVPFNAEGSFGIELGNDTELFDDNSVTVPHSSPASPALSWQIVPEPGSISLLGLGFLLVYRKRRK